MNFFQRRKILKSTSAEDLIPIRTRGHEVVDGKVVILTPKFESPRMHKLFPLTEQQFYRTKLDDLGSLTWENISGDKSVSEITDTVQKKLNGSRQVMEDAGGRIAKFISLLYEHRHVTFRQIL